MQYLIQIDFKLGNPLADIRNVNKQPVRAIPSKSPNGS